MSKIQFENTLFMYKVEADGDFWAYAGGQYHRFSFRGSDIRFIRSQSYLPERAYGSCFYLTKESVRRLEKECQRAHIVLHFTDSLEKCQQQAALEYSYQYIFDQTPPAGYFYVGNGIEKQFGDGFEEI